MHARFVMVARAGSPATRSCEPRQARKGAAAAADACAGVQLVRAAAFASFFEAFECQLPKRPAVADT